MLLVRGVEVIIGAVLDLYFGIGWGAVTICRRWLAALSVDSLNRCYAAKHAAAGMIRHVDHEPRNRTGRRSVCLGRHLPDDLTSIIMFPTWACAMLANFFALPVEQVRFGPLECPDLLSIRPGLASVDLDARRMHLQNNSLAGWSFEIIWHFRPLDVSEVGH